MLRLVLLGGWLHKFKTGESLCVNVKIVNVKIVNVNAVVSNNQQEKIDVKEICNMSIIDFIFVWRK